ncbi:MAG: hypothetical protein ACFCD0_28920 [Gemmataceae bacterium]
MSKPVMEIVLPRLARPLYRQLERYWLGELDDDQFTERFEALLQKQHAWLARRGLSDVRAAVVIHAALLILSNSGLKAEAEETGLPLEIIEFRAIKEAASDVERNYGIPEPKVVRVIAKLLAKYAE